ncbi:MAG: hypothetical protein O2962_01560, partial [Cyanobacteria bacterium]|nr:hypothetical protein [Cyanobacteriota bacterium]
ATKTTNLLPGEFTETEDKQLSAGNFPKTLLDDRGYLKPEKAQALKAELVKLSTNAVDGRIFFLAKSFLVVQKLPLDYSYTIDTQYQRLYDPSINLSSEQVSKKIYSAIPVLRDLIYYALESPDDPYYNLATGINNWLKLQKLGAEQEQS